MIVVTKRIQRRKTLEKLIVKRKLSLEVFSAFQVSCLDCGTEFCSLFIFPYPLCSNYWPGSCSTDKHPWMLIFKVFRKQKFRFFELVHFQRSWEVSCFRKRPRKWRNNFSCSSCNLCTMHVLLWNKHTYCFKIGSTDVYTPSTQCVHLLWMKSFSTKLSFAIICSVFGSWNQWLLDFQQSSLSYKQY